MDFGSDYYILDTRVEVAESKSSEFITGSGHFRKLRRNECKPAPEILEGRCERIKSDVESSTRKIITTWRVVATAPTARHGSALHKIIAKTKNALRMVQMIKNRNRGLKYGDLLRLINAFVLCHFSYMVAMQKWLGGERDKLNALIERMDSGC
ncbi:hypothetical protein HPB50_017907 [Hyalomma asiaticum]|uniref:Uncharacterized protein n=1 Tax=Hyalomma asiaticum TaxID=266040 RepID=A0ACB7RX44_HYAAI|nr:hypothetical protein HPB50_017907 [Hyalomma asiaticum]